jgi:hypothetical protein
METNEYNVISYNFNRYCITKNYQVIDNANGYGYKTKQSAYAALNYKYLGGIEKKQQEKKQFKNYRRRNPKVKELLEKYNNLCEIYQEDIYFGKESKKDFLNELMTEYQLDIPKKFVDIILTKN